MGRVDENATPESTMPVGNTQLLADDVVARWLIENSPISIPFFQAWAWQYVTGKSLIYPRTPELSPGEARDDCQTVAVSNPVISQAEFEFADYRVDWQWYHDTPGKAAQATPPSSRGLTSGSACRPVLRWAVRAR